MSTDDHASLGGGLAGDLGPRVVLEAGVEDSIADLVADLVRVTLSLYTDASADAPPSRDC